MILQLLSISVICCFFVNSGASDTIKHIVWRMLKGKAQYQDYSLRPIDCELCLTFWTSIIYLMAQHQLSLYNILLACVVAWLSPVVVDILHILKNAPRRLIDRFN